MFIFSLLLWGSVTQSGGTQDKFCRAMYLSSRYVRRTQQAGNASHWGSMLTRLHLMTALRKSKVPEILRKWSHLKYTRGNWGNKAKMMRRFKMVHSINKGITQWTCVSSTGLLGGGGRVRGHYTEPCPDQHTWNQRHNPLPYQGNQVKRTQEDTWGGSPSHKWDNRDIWVSKRILRVKDYKH